MHVRYKGMGGVSFRYREGQCHSRKSSIRFRAMNPTPPPLTRFPGGQRNSRNEQRREFGICSIAGGSRQRSGGFTPVGRASRSVGMPRPDRFRSFVGSGCSLVDSRTAGSARAVGSPPQDCCVRVGSARFPFQPSLSRQHAIPGRDPLARLCVLDRDCLPPRQMAQTTGNQIVHFACTERWIVVPDSNPHRLLLSVEPPLDMDCSSQTRTHGPNRPARPRGVKTLRCGKG